MKDILDDDFGDDGPYSQYQFMFYKLKEREKLDNISTTLTSSITPTRTSSLVNIDASIVTVTLRMQNCSLQDGYQALVRGGTTKAPD
jgi:hypothetical protein